MPAATMATAGMEVNDGIQAMHTLKSIDPPLFLAPSEQLSNAARLASGYLFDSLKPYAPKSPFSQLLVNGFDAEQIWQQIDLQSQPLISSLRRKVKKFEKNPDELRAVFNLGEKEATANGAADVNGKREAGEEASEDDVGVFDDEEMEDLEDEGEDDEESDEEEEEGGKGIEDRFLKTKEMKKFLDEEEDAWYGMKKKKGGKIRGDEDDDEYDDEEDGDMEGSSSDDDEMDNVGGKVVKDDDEDDEDDEEDDEDELGIYAAEDDGSEDELGKDRYDDFFGTKAKAGQKRKSKPHEVSDDLDMDRPSRDGTRIEKKQSSHEKELERMRSNIEEMEKANMDPKAWTMQGEVTAAKRPKNSALETDLDFDHNARPPPVITEEVTESLEEIIKKRILEARFDNVQKPQTLPSKAPRQVKEMDENKSKKGLAEIYEEEFVQKTGLVSASMSFSDQQKKEAANLFKELCVKLDALSHFHFTPKPVIEDMSIQANVPALAMEEIAPLAVSDASMLAPEEIFSGKGDIKEEKELTQAERKRRRAKKKRIFKAVTAKKNYSKAQRQQTLSTDKVGGNEES